MNLKEFEKQAFYALEGSNNPKRTLEMIKRQYVPVLLQHISEHGCSGLKCKRCPLDSACDKDLSHVKELAAKNYALLKIWNKK
jgi:hypothetical protein